MPPRSSGWGHPALTLSLPYLVPWFAIFLVCNHPGVVTFVMVPQYPGAVALEGPCRKLPSPARPKPLRGGALLGGVWGTISSAGNLVWEGLRARGVLGDLLRVGPEGGWGSPGLPHHPTQPVVGVAPGSLGPPPHGPRPRLGHASPPTPGQTVQQLESVSRFSWPVVMPHPWGWARSPAPPQDAASFRMLASCRPPGALPPCGPRRRGCGSTAAWRGTQPPLRPSHHPPFHEPRPEAGRGQTLRGMVSAGGSAHKDSPWPRRGTGPPPRPGTPYFGHSSGCPLLPRAACPLPIPPPAAQLPTAPPPQPSPRRVQGIPAPGHRPDLT